MNDVAEMADKIFIMDAGKIVRQGTPKEIFRERDFLKTIGLGLPQATELAAILEEQGFAAIEDVVLTIPELTDYITRNLNGDLR
jgi:ABC-type dipeptide/oligopeptide/nickel transport system ATPase component